MFGIGEFSKVTGLTVKTLRFYHEEGLLVPSFVDPQTGYRYYDRGKVETARAIAFLRALEFSVSEIREILRDEGDGPSLDVMRRHKAVLEQRIKRLRKTVRSLDQFLSDERQATAMAASAYQVQEKVLDPLLVGGVRMKGRYSDCGGGFARLGRVLGRHIRGKPLLLHYDTEYREDDADFEACFPVGRACAADGVSVRELPAARCVALVHQGPYEQLGRSYAKVFAYVKEKGYRVVMPTREVYLKGPGMIFRGNPRNYLTEIQVPVDDARGGA